MTTGLAEQLVILQRIAMFAATLRGHELEAWRTAQGTASARCAHCGAELHLCFPAIVPEMDGSALDETCSERAITKRAA